MPRKAYGIEKLADTRQVVPTERKKEARPDDALQKSEHCHVLTIGPALLLDKAAAETKLAKVLRFIFRKIMGRFSCVHITLQAKGKPSATQSNGLHVTSIHKEKSCLPNGSVSFLAE